MFDIDKLYVMLPEFNMNNVYNIKAAWNNFYEANPDIVDEIDKNMGEALQKFIQEQTSDWDEAADLDDIADITEEFNEWIKKEGIKRYHFSEAAQERFSEWFKSHRKEYFIKKKISKVKYNHDKTPQENSLKARNNLLIDMMWGVLTNADTASKILNPGGFDYQKKAARIMDILTVSTEKDLAKALQEIGIQFNKTIQKNGKTYPKAISSYLFDLDLDILDKLAESTKIKMDPLSPRTQVNLHQQNMTGAKMIGIYANHNANHALMQHTDLGLDSENGAFILNGKTLTSLHNIMNNDKEFISKNNAGFLAASVDNVKDPVLASLNQNTFTADATMLLSRLGYNPIEIGLLMTQPIVKEMTQLYFREVREGKNKEAVINEILKKYKEKAALNSDLTYEDYKNNKFLIEDLADYIIISKEATTDSSSTSDFRKIEFYQKQVAVGYLFKRIMNSADALGQLTQATRADTQGGAAGPTIADTMQKIQKVDNFLKKVYNDIKFPLTGADVIGMGLFEDVGTENIDIVRERLLESPLPFLQAFYSLGIEQSSEMLSKYFPHFRPSFISVIDKLRDMTKSGKLNVKTMNNIYNDLLAYIMSKTQFFGERTALNLNSDTEYSTVSSYESRKKFINTFPEEFKKVVTKNPDIAELEFIKRLKVIRANENNPVATLVFKNVGQLSPNLRERYMRDWASLLYKKNPEAIKLALNLFRYSFYRNGFAFGPNTFIHLAPVAIRKAIPEYIDTLRSLLLSDDDYSQFIDQYVYNHLDNRKLVPEIPDTATVKFTDDNGNIKDSVTFIMDEESSPGDSTVVKKLPSFPGDSYTFMNYIGKRINGRWVYYKLDNLTDDNVAVYTRIEPLGYRNSFIEYEYGKSVITYEELKKIREKRDKDRDDAKKAGIAYVEPSNDFIETVISESKASYDPYADTLSKFDVDVDYESESNAFEVPIDNIVSAGAQAFSQNYGTEFEGEFIPNDITQMQPNIIDDANGEKACGAVELMNL